jgi:uncharacterized protein (TIGR02271 family)
MAEEQQPQQMIVIDRDGERGVIRAYHPQQDQYVIDYGDETLLIPSDLLVALGQTYYTAPMRFADAIQGNADLAESVVIPVLEEELHLAKRVVEVAKVRAHKEIKEREVLVDEPLIEDRVEIERVPINRPVKKAIRPRVEGDTTIIPVLKEVLVVKKQLMLMEEIRLSRRQVEVRHPQSVTLRSEIMHIDRVENEAAAGNAQVYSSNSE